MPRSTLIHALALAVGLTGLALTLTGCDDLPAENAVSTSTGDEPTTGDAAEESSTTGEDDGSSSTGVIVGDQSATTSGGGWGGDTGELGCGGEQCDADRFCMTYPQTGERLCVEPCTAAATCLAVTEECVTVAGLSACFPIACGELADCPDGAVECNGGRCI